LNLPDFQLRQPDFFSVCRIMSSSS